MLQLKLFGQFSIEYNGHPVSVPTRSAQSLLAYLALNAGISQRRLQLAGIFWPDASEANARSNLRRALWRIRSTIDPDYITADNVSIAFDAASDYWLDAEVLAVGIEENRSPPEQVDMLANAVSVYRGDLLPGYYDDWVLLERQRFGAIHDQQITRLLDLLAMHRRWQEMLQWSERWLALGQTPEPAYRALMVAHAELGNQAGVAAAYQRCVDSLRADLDVEPSRETIALKEQLTGGDILSRATIETTAREGGEPEEFEEDAAPLLPSFLRDEIDPPPRQTNLFVQREQELSRLDTFLEKALASQGQIVFVTGGAGRGKTALLDEFVRLAHETHEDLIVASGQCTAYTGVGDPYMPFRDIMTVLAGNVDAKWSAGAMTRQHAQRLWKLMPHTLEALLDFGPDLIDIFVSAADLLRRVEGILPESSDSLKQLKQLMQKRRDAEGFEQRYLFDQYAAVLQNLSGPHPMLITLDDLQWADVASIGLLFHLSRRTVGNRIMFVCAYRPDEVISHGKGDRHPLQKLLTESKRVFGDAWIDLTFGSASDGREFLDALVDAHPNRLNETFRQELFRLTNGHSLFTIEFLRDLQARGDLVQDEDGYWIEGHALNWQVLPARVEGVIEERFGRLEPELRRILDVASVEGETFIAEVLAAVTGISPLQVLHDLTYKLAGGHRLISEVEEVRAGSGSLSRYRFTHILFQQYLYSALSMGERRLLHVKIGKTLESIYVGQTDEIAAHLLHHFRAAGHRDKTVEYARQAARHARAIYAYDEAIQHLQTALACFEPGQQIAIQMALVEELGDAYGLIRQDPEAVSCYRATILLCSSPADANADILVRLHCKICERAFGAKWSSGLDESQKLSEVLAESRHFLEKYLDQEQNEPPSLERVHVLTTLADDARIVLCSDTSLEQSLRYAQAAVATAAELNSPVALLEALLALSSVYYAYGLISEQLEIVDRLLALIRDPGLADVRKRLKVLRNAGQVFIQAGQYSKAIGHLLELKRRSSEIGSVADQVGALGDLGHCLFQLDRWDELFEVYEENRALSRRYPADQAGTNCFLISLCATVHALRGLSEEARDLRDESYSIMERAVGGVIQDWAQDPHY